MSCDPSPAFTSSAGFAEPGSLLVEDQRFAIVPDWVIGADLSDAAFRVYSLLLRFGNGSGCRMPCAPGDTEAFTHVRWSP